MRSIPVRGRRPLSHRPHRFSRASAYATDCGLTPLARYSSIYESSNRSHLLIAALPNVSKRTHVRASKRYRNKQYDLQYDFLGGHDEPRTELNRRQYTHEALRFAFIGMLSLLVLEIALESFGFPRVPGYGNAAFAVIFWSLGLAISSWQRHWRHQ